jgi:hypothetical protein
MEGARWRGELWRGNGMRPDDVSVTERGGAGEEEGGWVVSVRKAGSGRVSSGQGGEKGRSERASGSLGRGALGREASRVSR